MKLQILLSTHWIAIETDLLSIAWDVCIALSMTFHFYLIITKTPVINCINHLKWYDLHSVLVIGIVHCTLQIYLYDFKNRSIDVVVCFLLK